MRQLNTEYVYLSEAEVEKHRCNVLYAYTDGSCYPNPGPGGWGVRLIWNLIAREIYGGGPDQTNNTMELMAIKMAIMARKRRSVPMIVYSDSKYSIGALSKWWRDWERNGWRTSKGDAVKNQDIIKSTISMITDNIEFKWIKGHVGHVHNERVDKLAGMGRRQYGGLK